MKEEREQQRTNDLLKMEKLQLERADKACDSKLKNVTMKAKRAESLASIREGLTLENKNWIKKQTEHE